MKAEGNIITDWLNQNRNQEIDSFIEKNLAITEKVRLAMENKGWKSQDLAKAMDKSPSEVSKWLSGMHNLTLKSIIKMEMAFVDSATRQLKRVRQPFLPEVEVVAPFMVAIAPLMSV